MNDELVFLELIDSIFFNIQNAFTKNSIYIIDEYILQKEDDEWILSVEVEQEEWGIKSFCNVKEAFKYLFSLTQDFHEEDEVFKRLQRIILQECEFTQKPSLQRRK